MLASVILTVNVKVVAITCVRSLLWRFYIKGTKKLMLHNISNLYKLYGCFVKLKQLA